jgi:predicted permease
MKLLRRIDYWLHRREREAELAEEMEFHRSSLDMSGDMAGAPARFGARFGNATLAREDARAIWIWPWLESIVQDLRYALRNLRQQPGFAMIALLTLGIAIGLNTSLFTVFDAVAFRLWPVKDPAHLVKILAQGQRIRNPRGFPVAEYRYFAEHAKSLSAIVAMNGSRVRLGFEDFGKASSVTFVSGNYFQGLGVSMERGRGFMQDEDVLDTPENVAVLSYPLWRDHFFSDPAIVGKQIHADGVALTVVGVVSEEFTGTMGGREDLWIPLPAMQSFRLQGNTRAFLRDPDDCCSALAGRLAPGYSRDQAQSELAVLSRQFHEQYKLDQVTILLADPSILAAHSKRRTFMPVFGLMFAGLALVLLLACANVSNLLLARAAARQREIEVRRALGAGRARIVRQLLTEGFVLAMAAAALGIALAWRLPAYVFALTDDPLNVRLTPDATVILYATALAAITCIIFALAPALHGTRPNSTRSRLPLRSVLLGAQVAMSVVLLIGAGLMVSGVKHAQERDPGFRIKDVSVISFEVPVSSYDSSRTLAFFSQLSRELEGLPELGPVGIAAREPLGNSHWNYPFRLPSEAPGIEHDIEYNQISPGYFDVLGVPFVVGRNFQPADFGRHYIVVNESMSHRYFPGMDPIGKSIIIGANANPSQIIGVVRDASLAYVEGPGPYLFSLFGGDQIPKLLVRSNVPGSAEIIAGMTKRIDARARVQASPLTDDLDRQLGGSRAMAGIAGMLGMFAMILAVIGMSGVFAYVVQQRTKEIGIRMALGAEPKQVIALVLAGTTRAAIIGLAIGYVAAAGCARLLAEYLYGVSPYDPRAYFEVAAILAISALAAAYLPARRATRVHPLNALRVE